MGERDHGNCELNFEGPQEGLVKSYLALTDQSSRVVRRCPTNTGSLSPAGDDEATRQELKGQEPSANSQGFIIIYVNMRQEKDLADHEALGL